MKIKTSHKKDMIPIFWSRVKVGKPDECWEWMRGVSTKLSPYGVLWHHKTKYKTHRLSYYLTKGDPGDLMVCHKCDNPRCVNPNHLFLGTHRDNALDCVSKNRHNRECGEDRYCAKLNRDAVLDIKKNYRKWSVGVPFFANKYNVSKTAVYNIITGLRWKHVTV